MATATDLLDRGIRDDPYPLYDELRESEGGVHFIEAVDTWVVTRWGMHYCLGAPLARLDARVAFTRLLERFPEIAPGDGDPVWKRDLFARGFDSLPVYLG